MTTSQVPRFRCAGYRLVTAWFLLLLVATAAAGHGMIAPPQDSRIPRLQSVFGKLRKDQDIVYFRNGDLSKGAVLNESFTIATPYGEVEVDLRKCAGLSFEGSRANTEAIVTVNRNRITGVIRDRHIRFQEEPSGTKYDFRKEKVRFVVLRQFEDELAFFVPDEQRVLLLMANGDVLTGQFTEAGIKITTDYAASMAVLFDQIRSIEMQGEDNPTALVIEKNKTTKRGVLDTEELTLNLDIGVSIEAIYKDEFSKMLFDARDVPDELSQLFDTMQPKEGESAGALLADKKRFVQMDTSMGPIVLELFADRAPATVRNFLAYVDDGFYDGRIFHHIRSDLIIGGGFDVDRQPGSTRPPITNEWPNGLKNRRGTIVSYRPFVRQRGKVGAHHNPDSATSQFLINLDDNPELDYREKNERVFGPEDWAYLRQGFAVFGKVTQGMDIVDKIARVTTVKTGAFPKLPKQPVIITKVRRCERPSG